MRIKKVTQTTPISGEIVDSLDGNSTDKAPSIRAVNEALLDAYSTEETRIGTWIDGKPIYRITKHFTSSGVGNITFAHGINNIDNLVNLYGFGNKRNDGYYTILNNPHNVAYEYCEGGINDSSITINIGDSRSGAAAITDHYITFEYTKTTDTTDLSL